MTFEQQVMVSVSPLLHTGDAEFYNGSLFLENTDKVQAENILFELNKRFGEIYGFIFTEYPGINGFVIDFR